MRNLSSVRSGNAPASLSRNPRNFPGTTSRSTHTSTSPRYLTGTSGKLIFTFGTTGSAGFNSRGRSNRTSGGTTAARTVTTAAIRTQRRDRGRGAGGGCMFNGVAGSHGVVSDIGEGKGVAPALFG